MKFVLELSISKAPWLKDNARERNFWIMIEDDKVIGAYSLMTYDEDYLDTDWLSWLCIDEDQRGRGLGKQLINHAIAMAKQREKKFLKLWTTTKPHEKTAHFLYDSIGFDVFNTIDDPDEPSIQRIYRSLKL